MFSGFLHLHLPLFFLCLQSFSNSSVLPYMMMLLGQFSKLHTSTCVLSLLVMVHGVLNLTNKIYLSIFSLHFMFSHSHPLNQLLVYYGSFNQEPRFTTKSVFRSSKLCSLTKSQVLLSNCLFDPNSCPAFLHVILKLCFPVWHHIYPTNYSYL